MNSNKLERVLSIVLTMAAVVMAVAIVRRELADPNPTVVNLENARAPRYDSTWTELLTSARVISGGRDPRIHVFEFADLECPACRQFHELTLPAVHRAYGDRVAVHFIHFPLRVHRFANAAAQAAECAATDGRFAQFIGIAYAKQDSFGLKPWSAIARETGVRDVPAFDACQAKAARSALVDSGAAAADRLGLHATPSVMVNGWLFPVPPSSAELNRVIADLLENRRPTFVRKDGGG